MMYASVSPFRGLPGHRVLGEVEHLGTNHLLRRVVPREQLSPGAPAALRIDREVLLDQLIGAVYDSVAVHIRIRVLIPEGQLCRGGAGEDDAGRLEVHLEVDGVDRQGDEDRVAPAERHAVGPRHETVDRDLEPQERVARELAGNAAVIDADRRLRPPFGPERHLVGLEPRRGRGLPEHRDRAGRRRHGLGARRRDRGGGRRGEIRAPRCHHRECETKRKQPSAHASLRAHGSYHDTAYCEKCRSSVQTNAREAPSPDASFIQGARFPCRIQIASCCFNASSVASTTPSPFRSGLAFSYHIASVAGWCLSNTTPLGWKSTVKARRSIVKVMSNESCFRKLRSSSSLSPGPRLSPSLGMSKRRNGCPVV